jgi:hypothetical protein
MEQAVQHLPTTNLELFTLGIVVCSLGTYAVFWQRPQAIRLPIFKKTPGLSAVLTGIFGVCYLIGWVPPTRASVRGRGTGRKQKKVPDKTADISLD